MFKKSLGGLLLVFCISSSNIVFAAEKIDLSGDVASNLPLLEKFSLIQSSLTRQKLQRGLQLAHDYSSPKNTINTFQLIGGFVDNKKQSVVRYSQFYRELPVWGMQIIYSIAPDKTTVRGTILDRIEQDIPNVTSGISVDQIKKIVQGSNKIDTDMSVEKVIYYNEALSKKAILAYKVSYLSKANDNISIMSSFYDANNGNKLEEWDQLPTQ